GDQLPDALRRQRGEAAANSPAHHRLAGDRPLRPPRWPLAVHLSPVRAPVRGRGADHQSQAGRRQVTNAKRGALDEADLLVTRNLIDGEWVAGAAVPIAVEDPYTLETIAEVPISART